MKAALSPSASVSEMGVTRRPRSSSSVTATAASAASPARKLSPEAIAADTEPSASSTASSTVETASVVAASSAAKETAAGGSPARKSPSCVTSTTTRSGTVRSPTRVRVKVALSPSATEESDAARLTTGRSSSSITPVASPAPMAALEGSLKVTVKLSSASSTSSSRTGTHRDSSVVPAGKVSVPVVSS